MKQIKKKKLLFIEPNRSSLEFCYHAKQSGHTTLLLSGQASTELVLKSASSFFHVNTEDELAVLDLAERIDQKFNVDGVIPGKKEYLHLAAKVALRLKKIGLSPATAQKISKAKDYQLFSLETDDMSQEGEFIVQGITQGNRIQILSVMQQLIHPLEGQHFGMIVMPELNHSLNKLFTHFASKVMTALKINYSPFEITCKVVKNGITLKNFKSELTPLIQAKLLNYASGIDYYDNVIRLYCSHPLNLKKTKNTNVAMLYFTAQDLGSQETFEYMIESPFIREVKSYQSNFPSHSYDIEQDVWGHAIFTHENYQELKSEILKIKGIKQL